MSAASPITIVVLIALQEEHDLFLEIFPMEADRSVGRHICIEHKIATDVRLISILAEQMGAESAGASAQIALDNFSPDLIVLLGIAGAVSDDVEIADVCVSNEIIDVLQNAKVYDKGRGTDILLAPNFYNVGAELVSSFTFLRSHPSLKTKYDDWRLTAGGYADKLKVGGDDCLPQLHIGPVACGPVVASKKYLEKLRQLHRKVLAIETESGGAGNRAQDKHVPFITIRGISDRADAFKASLEKSTNGAARKAAMYSACHLLNAQIQNERFLEAVVRSSRSGDHPELFPLSLSNSIVAELEGEIRARLSDHSPEFKARPEGFYLPVPRARRVSFGEQAVAKELDDPENLFEAVKGNERVFLRLPRTFPAQGLGWSLANSFIRQQLSNKVVLPYVISGDSIVPPKTGLAHHLPEYLKPALGDQSYELVVIIDELPLDSRSRLKFLIEEVKSFGGHILAISKVEDNPTSTDNYIRDTASAEYELSPVSFAETAFFLEKAFDMNPHEAEAVAIRLDDTFRKFRLEAHPTYFAGLQEETLAALINANKRAELIQLAVDGLLTLMVAADHAKPRLSRTTRERFLKRVVQEIASNDDGVSDEQLTHLSNEFLKEYAFDISSTEFLNPFFRIGILYRTQGKIRFSHPYLESYLLAQALRDDLNLARSYFDPKKTIFNYYAYDLYCEMGPHIEVMDLVKNFSDGVLQTASEHYAESHVYLGNPHLTTISTKNQLATFTQRLTQAAEQLDKDDKTDNVRSIKQRILDAKHHVNSQAPTGPGPEDSNLPVEIKVEFHILDDLARALALTATGVGSGSESMTGDCKKDLATLVLAIGAKFADVWTRNRLRVDFKEANADLLSDANIWSFIEETGAPPEAYDTVKSEMSLFLHGFELNHVAEPLGRVMSRISSLAGVKVLEPVISEITGNNKIEEILKSCWFMDINSARGKDMLQSSLSDYKGSNVLRLVVASHLVWRVFWHHYKTAGAINFINGAKRALSPLGLQPASKHVDVATKGAGFLSGPE